MQEDLYDLAHVMKLTLASLHGALRVPDYNYVIIQRQSRTNSRVITFGIFKSFLD